MGCRNACICSGRCSESCYKAEKYCGEAEDIYDELHGKSKEEEEYYKAKEEECELLKSLLYCTVKSCNNCGKVNCENFQRQRIDYCSLWVSYKDYIAKLEKQNSVLKKKNSDEEYYKAMEEQEERLRQEQIQTYDFERGDAKY